MADIVERLRSVTRLMRKTEEVTYHQDDGLALEAADEITALRAENERLKIENIQMQAALGYGILAEDERHILPSNPFKCGTCDASKHLRAENERLRAALEPFATALKGNWSHQPDTMRIDAGFGPTDLRMTLTLGAFRIARAALEEGK